MTSKTHLPFGLLSGLAILQYDPSLCDTMQYAQYITMSGAMFGSLMPDLDTHKSSLSQIIPWLSTVVDKVTKHRGDTHTIFPFIFVILYYLLKCYPCLPIGIGNISHLVLDRVTTFFGITCNSKGEEKLYYVLWLILL